MSRSVRLTLIVSVKCCSEKQNTHFVFHNYFDNVPLWGNVWKYDIALQVANDSAFFGQVIKQNRQFMCIYLKKQTNWVPISPEGFFKSIFNIS